MVSGDRADGVDRIGVIELPQMIAGRYALERLLGRGGMAAVYVGWDRRLGRRVAVKVVPMHATDAAGRERFVREARSAAGLLHPNAVAVFDAGDADGYLYIVMELVDGTSLADTLAERGPLSPQQATRIAAAVLAALETAHASGVVHRDVKPSNIMVSTDGTVKLLDFGIAGRLDEIADGRTARDRRHAPLPRPGTDRREAGDGSDRCLLRGCRPVRDAHRTSRPSTVTVRSRRRSPTATNRCRTCDRCGPTHRRRWPR